MGKKETIDVSNEELEVVDIKEESEVKETVKAKKPRGRKPKKKEETEAVKEEIKTEEIKAETEAKEDADKASEPKETKDTESETTEVKAENKTDKVNITKKLANLILKLKDKNNRLVSILACAVIVLLIAVLVITFLPSNVYKRAIKRADAFYDQGAFADAMTNYIKAENAEKSLVYPVLGTINTALAIKSDGIKDSYKAAVSNVLSFKHHKEEEKDYYAEFFLLSNEIYADNAKERLDVLKSGSELFENFSELNTSLSDAYFDYGVENENKDVKLALENFDEALKLSNNAEAQVSKVREVVLAYIDFLNATDNFDEAESILNKYKDTLSLNEEEILSKINLARELSEIKHELLKNVHDTMKPVYDSFEGSFSKETVTAFASPMERLMQYDWSEMMQLDGSAAADSLAFSGSQSSYLYAEGGVTPDYTGVGCAMYTYGNYTDENGENRCGYYFYYGNFKNGKRDGYGITFVKSASTSFKAFEGEWKEDAPNGFGVMYESDKYDYTSLAKCLIVTYGDYKNGLQDKEMTILAALNEHPDTFFTTTYEASEGVVPYLEGDLTDYGIIGEAPSNKKLIVVAPSVTDGYEYFFTVFINEGEKLGVEGFK